VAEAASAQPRQRPATGAHRSLQDLQNSRLSYFIITVLGCHLTPAECPSFFGRLLRNRNKALRRYIALLSVQLGVHLPVSARMYVLPL
jgi:hypothetical protein